MIKGPFLAATSRCVYCTGSFCLALIHQFKLLAWNLVGYGLKKTKQKKLNQKLQVQTTHPSGKVLILSVVKSVNHFTTYNKVNNTMRIFVFMVGFLPAKSFILKNKLPHGITLLRCHNQWPRQTICLPGQSPSYSNIDIYMMHYTQVLHNVTYCANVHAKIS